MIWTRRRGGAVRAWFMHRLRTPPGELYLLAVRSHSGRSASC
jgi:hypothetical protein